MPRMKTFGCEARWFEAPGPNVNPPWITDSAGVKRKKRNRTEPNMRIDESLTPLDAINDLFAHLGAATVRKWELTRFVELADPSREDMALNALLSGDANYIEATKPRFGRYDTEPTLMQLMRLLCYHRHLSAIPLAGSDMTGRFHPEHGLYDESVGLMIFDWNLPFIASARVTNRVSRVARPMVELVVPINKPMPFRYRYLVLRNIRRYECAAFRIEVVEDSLVHSLQTRLNRRTMLIPDKRLRDAMEDEPPPLEGDIGKTEVEMANAIHKDMTEMGLLGRGKEEKEDSRNSYKPRQPNELMPWHHALLPFIARNAYLHEVYNHFSLNH